MTVKSAAMPSVALLVMGLMASGNIFAASDSPRGRHKPQQQSQQAAPEPAAVTPLPQARPAEMPAVEEKPPVVAVPERPAAVVIDSREAAGLLGREVRSAADENMGRIVDMLVDSGGQIRAAIIDFGGFLGVGSRKIAVDWKALRFPEDRKRVVLEMTREQVRAAPEYQEGKPIFVLSATGLGPALVTTGTGSAGR